MGFCFFNNVAVAARWLQTVYGSGGQKDVNGKEIKMQKVLILDWDVHHGTFSLCIYANRPSLNLTIRLFRQETELRKLSKTTPMFSTSRFIDMETISTLEVLTELSSLSDLVPVKDCSYSVSSPQTLQSWRCTDLPRQNHSSVNIPFHEQGMGDADYIYAFQQIVMPIAYEFAPDIVLGTLSFALTRRSTWD